MLVAAVPLPAYATPVNETLYHLLLAYSKLSFHCSLTKEKLAIAVKYI